ncbi:DNA polymerase III subunit epsilon [Agaribacterium haliotis]|uniref:DNA polymerase III subunit epsilon n=1 Tax=Agaribacterium haliotis TaxID=2013869 RepID=UPI000BB590CB|nr:DNA polymerase III subunit epsilon [Agaribacterium haliotis]
MRQVVLDTETTGLEPSAGHRIIEIGCVELFNRKLTGRHYHQYINPEREVDQGAMEVHGITNEFLLDKPVFRSVVDEFIEFVDGAELVIHNAPFDVGFINHEFKLLQRQQPVLESFCSILDTLKLARDKHPGQKNNLDALCKRYDIDNSQRDLHGALLDSEILADVYLAMTGGQTKLVFNAGESSGGGGPEAIRRVDARSSALVIPASADELAAHEAKLDNIGKKLENGALWRRLS